MVLGVLGANEVAVQKYWTERHQFEHSAWVKLTGRTDITYEEWMALRRAGIEVNTTTK